MYFDGVNGGTDKSLLCKSSRMAVQPLTGDIDEVLDGVPLAQLAAGDRAGVQYFGLKPGSLIEVRSHDHEQIGWVSDGELVFTVDGGKYHAVPNTSYPIPGGEPHSAEDDVDVVGIEAFSPLRPSPPRTGDGR